MIDILKTYAAECITTSRAVAVPQVQSTLAKLSLCRTPALGHHRYRCRQCDHETTVYNSCGDRHCPQCAGAKRADWLDSAAALLLPELPYFQVVFTIPDQLSSLALGNRRVLFDLLFRSAWSALKQVIEDEQQFEPAAAMVLHTWNQKLDAHLHVHALVPGGGPSLIEPGTWQSSRPPAHENQRRKWLVDADELRVAFRREFLRGLRSLRRRHKLQLTGAWSFLADDAAFENWVKPLENISWVTYIQQPPEHSSPEHVVKYLARYMTGGPLSDRRLVSHNGRDLVFRARTGTTHGGSDQTEDVPLSGVEFVRRWCLHILPRGYTKTRRFGGYSNRHSARYLKECRTLRGYAEWDATDPAGGPTITPPDAAQQHLCPHCKVPLRLVWRLDRPGWSHVMNSPHRPFWYDDG